MQNFRISFFTHLFSSTSTQNKTKQTWEEKKKTDQIMSELSLLPFTMGQIYLYKSFFLVSEN